MSIFDELEDESAATLGEEVGAALSQAVANMGVQQDKMALIITKAIADALNAVDSKNIVVQQEERAPVKKWTLKVQRDAKGLMTSITATAEG